MFDVRRGYSNRGVHLYRHLEVRLQAAIPSTFKPADQDVNEYTTDAVSDEPRWISERSMGWPE